MQFINRLSCFPFALSSLQGNAAQVGTAVSLYLDKNIIATGKQWTGVENDAMNLLRQYPWPQNYLQLRRVLESIIDSSQQDHIEADDVKKALQAELSLASVSIDVNAAPYNSLNLSKDLSEINRDIVKMVLEKNGDNQSKAAASLGISRTTLWRMLK